MGLLQQHVQTSPLLGWDTLEVLAAIWVTGRTKALREKGYIYIMIRAKTAITG
jgi:hypothetical protein